MREFLIPSLLGRSISSASDVVATFAPVRGHPMALAAVESAVWDFLAKARGVPLSRMIGATLERVPVGVSIGIEPTIDEVIAQVNCMLKQGISG